MEYPAVQVCSPTLLDTDGGGKVEVELRRLSLTEDPVAWTQGLGVEEPGQEEADPGCPRHLTEGPQTALSSRSWYGLRPGLPSTAGTHTYSIMLNCSVQYSTVLYCTILYSRNLYNSLGKQIINHRVRIYQYILRHKCRVTATINKLSYVNFFHYFLLLRFYKCIFKRDKEMKEFFCIKRGRF